MAISHLSCCQGSWSISPGEFVTPGIPACRQSFMKVYRVKTRQKGRVAKRKEGVKGLKGKGGTGEGDGVRRRAEDKTGGIKRARPSVWTHESQILRCAGACMMFLFTGAPTRPMCPPALPPARSPALGEHVLHTRFVLPALGRSLVSVTSMLCEASSIKPHFYSGALHSLWPSGSPLPLTHWSITTHILWGRPPASSHKNTSVDVPLHPLRVRLCTRD